MSKPDLLKTISSLFLLTGIFFSSCKNADTTGVAVQAPGDQLHLIYADTITIATSTVPDVPLVSSSTTIEINKVKTTANLLGFYNDPFFGTSQASFYTQFVLSDSLKPLPVVSKDNALTVFSFKYFHVDSVVLKLGYCGFYGDSVSQQNIQIFELLGAIDRQVSYPPSSNFSYGSTELGHGSFRPHLNDSIKINGVKEAPQFSIRMPPLEGRIQDYLQANSFSVGSISDIFKGIYALSATTFSSGNGAVYYFNLGSPSTAITVYYHFTGQLASKGSYVVVRDTFISGFQNLVVNGTCARVTNFSNAIGGKPVEIAINSAQVGDSILYLKSLGVSKIKIVLPFLKAYNDKGYVINKATLQFFVDPLSVQDRNFAPPGQLEVTRIGDSGESIPLIDKIETTNYGGQYNAVTQSYSFTVTRHIQSLIRAKFNNNGLYIEFGGDQKTTRPERVLLNGAKSSRRARLLLTYTKI